MTPWSTLLAAVVATSLAGCAGAGGGPPRDVAALDACRTRADEIYQKQNRAELYRSDVFDTSSRDAPFATTGLPGITSRGLSGAYARANLVDDCLNAAQPGAATPNPAPAPAPAAGRGTAPPPP